MCCPAVCLPVCQAQELSQAEAGDGGLAELISRAAEGSTVLGDGGLQADVDYDRLAATGGWAGLDDACRQGSSGVSD